MGCDIATFGYRSISENRYRETVGFGYEQLIEGLVIEHRPGRTVTEYDNILVCAITGNVAPIHTDVQYAGSTPWGKPLVCSTVTLGMVAGMTVRSMSGLTLANLSLEDVTFRAPVFAGDTLYAESTVEERRISNSYPDRGIVSIRTTGNNQDREPVVSFKRTFFVPTSGDAYRDRMNY
jgi:itaconyl-CoA hydratase